MAALGCSQQSPPSTAAPGLHLRARPLHPKGSRDNKAAGVLASVPAPIPTSLSQEASAALAQSTGNP